MAISRYEAALRQVQSLSPADQKRLLNEIAERLNASSEQTNSILRLQGLGKEVWRDFDAQQYVNQERAGWNG